MKKVCPLALSCIIFLLSFSIFSAKIYAADNLSASSSSQQASKINYELPYPGLLPDSYLYIFRVIRDRIVGFLISDPLKKSEFDLLQSDKRLNAGIMLLNKGKTSLSLETISKAGNYFDEALVEAGKAKKQGMNVTEMMGKLRNALVKHEQELRDLTQKVSANFKQSFEKERERAVGFQERLNQ